ncbi:MAG TPA: serine/threonine-protein kinase [Nocardioidaceae bacterium]|nr:serine/threonine-protein kinase [Nocardioidaceae bacterium]
MTQMRDESWQLAAGDEVVPGCTAIEKLGGGNAYEAFRAFDERLFAPVVVKIVRPNLVEDSGTLRGLRREVEMVGRLNHPVVVRGFHARTEGARPYLALESLDGPRLSTLLRRHGKLPMEQLLPLGLEMCSALHYLRGCGVVHLDIKPANIIMGAPPRLIDLSIARSATDAAELDHVVGTDAYLAPEQADPAHTGPPGFAADIWGLGATMFEALTGCRPFAEGVQDEAAPPQQRWPQLVAQPAELPRRVPDVVSKPILACLDPSADARPTPRELAGLLEPLVDALPRPKLAGFRPRI